MSNPYYCVCAQGVWCEACHEEMCANATDEVSKGEIAEQDDYDSLRDYID
jgi:hypothetical protein